MAGNDWINSYLEAILDAGGAAEEISAAATASGAAGEKRDKSSLMLRERGRFSPARYFVEEVISGFDETDLYKTWVRVSFAAVAAFFLPPPGRSESPIVRRRLELVVFTLWCSRVFLTVDCFLLVFFWDADGGDEEPAGAQHAAGEHVVEDLEPCPEEEAGTRFSQ
jgi:hypothetical protein